MTMTVGEHVLERLGEWGVRRVYGYPGDGINGVVLAFADRDDMEFIQARHEEMCAFMACGQAKFTGELGVCLATSGPGAIHLLNGLYDAKLDRQPVLAIVGQQARTALGSEYQQEVDLKALFADACTFVETAVDPAQVRHLVDRAIRVALARRAPTAIVLPKDLQGEDAVAEPPHEHGTAHSGVGWSPPRVLPRDEDLRRAADVLNAGERVAMLVGQGAMGAAEELLETAELLGAGVAKALPGKPVLPDDLPFVTGSIGLLGTKPSWDLMQDCDTLLVVGSSSRTRSSCPRRARRAASRSTSTGRCSDCGTRWRPTWSATRARRSARSIRCSSAKRIALGARTSSAASPSGGR
jgi:pyruvate dehydrogenase (quinone)